MANFADLLRNFAGMKRAGASSPPEPVDDRTGSLRFRTHQVFAEFSRREQVDGTRIHAELHHVIDSDRLGEK